MTPFPLPLPATFYYPSKAFFRVSTCILEKDDVLSWRRDGDRFYITLKEGGTVDIYLTEQAAKEELKLYITAYVIKLKRMLNDIEGKLAKL